MKKCLGVIFYKGLKKENPSSLIPDHIICALTGGRFSHVELVLYKTKDDLYLCFSSSHRDRGLRFKEIDIHSGSWVFIEPENLPTLAAIGDFYSRYKNARYDYIGLVSTVYPMANFNITNRLFCSELVSEVFNIKHPYKVSPQGLYDLLIKGN